jgi:outer membrane murein-binding lipoprotein Lpp
MKAKRMMVMAVVAASVLVVGGESFARGGVAGAGGGRGQGALTMTQSTTQVRPVDSQRRNGTFLTTGTTASGSTTRPANGRGPMDGTGINHPAPTAPTSTTP